MRSSARRSAGLIGGATLGSQISQLLWLTAGSRVMSLHAFGAVLAAQALYAVLQNPLDIGTFYYGAREAADRPLADEERGSLVRIRLTIAVVAMCVGVAFAIVGEPKTMQAVAPFILALPLFALLNAWERYGAGDALPWSSYLLLRTAGPALAAAAFLLANSSMPLFVPGVVECLSIAGIAAVFGLQLPRNLLLALRARTGPWRSVTHIGAVSIFSQLTLASGTLLLSVSGANAAAAVYAVGMRLLTGLSGLMGVLGTALFPRVARNAKRDSGSLDDDTAAIRLAVRIVVCVCAAATIVVIAASSQLSRLFLNHTTASASVTLILIVCVAAAATLATTLAAMIIAREGERHLLRPYFVMVAVTILGGVCAILVQPADPVPVAVALIVGQLALVFGVAVRAERELPALVGDIRRGVAFAVLLTASGVVACLLSQPVRLLTLVVPVALSLVGLRAVRAAGLTVRRSHPLPR